MDLPEIESAFAFEAAAHTEAVASLNPYSEAESMNLGRGWLVYTGTLSNVHGVYGLGLDGPPEERDWAEIDRFFSRKERAPDFRIAPFTAPELKEGIRISHREYSREEVRGLVLAPLPQTPSAPLHEPDLAEWSLTFSRMRNPDCTEPDLLSLSKLHQKETRFYLRNGQASFTFFHRGIALIPYPAEETLPLQQEEAARFRCRCLVTAGRSDFPLLYERTLHEPV